MSSTSLRMELSMSDTKTVSPLRQRMIEDIYWGRLAAGDGDRLSVSGNLASKPIP
jgi:hypothetical protein